MLLNQFNGGLHTKSSPHLINQTEAVIANNVELSSGSIAPLNGLTALEQTIPLGSEGITRFSGQWVANNPSSSYVEFNDVLYMSDSINTITKSTNGVNFYELGLDAPSGKLTTSSAAAPTISHSVVTPTEDGLDVGTYSYVIKATTTLGNTIVINHEVTLTAVRDIVISFNDYTNIASYKVYRNYEGDYRFVGGATSESVTDTILDISSNSSTSDLKDATVYISYVYTYYSSSSGIESSPSEASSELAVLVNNTTVSNFVPSTDPTVDTIKVYRLGNTLTDYYHVVSLTNAYATYTDTLTDLEVLEGDGVLETTGYIRPPEGLKFLTEYNGALFSCIDSTLYFSNSGTVEVWTGFNFIEFPEHITGLGSTQNGLLVFSRNKTYIITGDSISNYSKYLLHGSQGCITHNTINYVDNNLLWLSLDGICVSTGSSVELLTWNRLGKVNVEPITSEVYENQYYLFHDEGTLVVDFRDTVVFYTLDLVVRGAHSLTNYMLWNLAI